MSKESCEKEARGLCASDMCYGEGECYSCEGIAKALHRREVEAFNQGLEKSAKIAENFESLCGPGDFPCQCICCQMIASKIRNKLKKEK